MPHVSVIIPTFQRSALLPRAIRSVLAQTFTDFEVLIIDDASNDSTVEVVKSITDTRIRYFCHDANQGGAAARNTGIKLAQGKYVAFLDDDDEWFPQKLHKQVMLLNESSSKVGGVYTGYTRVDSRSGKDLGVTLPTTTGDLSRALLYSNLIGSTSSLLLRKECFDTVGLFDASLPSFQDYDLWIRISQCFLFESIEEPLFKYYLHDKKIWTNPEKIISGLNTIMDRYWTGASLQRKYYSSLFLAAGVLFCFQGNMNDGRNAYRRSMRLDPLNWRTYFNFGVSLLGANGFSFLKTFKTRLLRKTQDSQASKAAIPCKNQR